MPEHATRRNFLASGLAFPALKPPARPPELRKDGLAFRTLGKTGLKLTTVSFGCMITSDGTVIERAADAGINYFDSARRYQNGNNERMVGMALKGRRQKVHLSSKTGSRSRQEALADLDTSLKELGTDYLDIWYLHSKSSPDQITDELRGALVAAKKAGKIRFGGVSTHSGHAELLPALVKMPEIDVVLTAYNFTMDPSMDLLIDKLEAAGKGVIAMKVMAGGFRKIAPGDRLYDKFKQEGFMLAALKWVLKNPKVHASIPSITDIDQLDENLKAMSQPFSEADQKMLALQLERIRPLYCRMCGGCDGVCAQGLPVADILRFLTYADGYGQFALGRERFLELPEDVRAVRCRDCEKCTIDCPNGVQVAHRLARAQECFA